MFTDRRANSRSTRRERQDWPPGKPFKILSLDGGGVKGIYTAELLCQCERDLCDRRPIVEHFDLIAGTSTGGIIALGLGLGFTAADISAFYRNDGRRIFPPLPSGRFSRLMNLISWAQGPKLDHKTLEAALKARFGDRLLGESRTRLVIPAFMMPRTEIAVFKTDHHADFRRDHLTPAWQVARATSAAPTYLKGLEHTESGKIFIDGGVWANNPVMVALVDAISAYNISFDQIEVLSIGTGHAPFSLSRADTVRGLIAWREAIRAAMFLTTDNATAQVKLILGPERCLRIEPIGSEAEIALDDYDAAFKTLPECAARDFSAHRDALAPLFSEIVAPRERYYSVSYSSPLSVS